MAYLAGEAHGSPRMILAMLRHLPEGSSYVARMSAPPIAGGPVPPQEIDPELESYLDRKSWTEDRRLQAQIINLLGMLVRYSVRWKEGEAPEFDIVGPAEWRDPKAKSTNTSKSIDDVLGMFLPK